MKTVFVIFRSGISGGTATLSIRIGEWLANNGYEVLYICQNYNDMNNVRTMKEKGIQVYKWGLKQIVNKLSKKYNSCNFNVLTYSLNEFLFIETLKERLRIIKSTLYAVGANGLIKGSKLPSIFRGITSIFYAKIIKELIANESVLFINKASLDLTEKYFRITIKNKKDIIYYLPIEVHPYDKNTVSRKAELETFNILTIARADFPFKGYIIGVIDDFKKLCDIHDNMTLTIITFGKDKDKIAEKIKKLPSEVQSKINLIGRTPYEKLREYFAQSHLFLGMGTTVLDAVNHSVPAIVVQPYTYENKTSGFFHKQPVRLTYEGNLVPAVKFMESIIQMSKHEYEELCKKEYDMLKEYYCMDTLINYLISDKNGRGVKKINSFDLKIHQFMINMKFFIKKRIQNY